VTSKVTFTSYFLLLLFTFVYHRPLSLIHPLPLLPSPTLILIYIRIKERGIVKILSSSRGVERGERGGEGWRPIFGRVRANISEYRIQNTFGLHVPMAFRIHRLKVPVAVVRHFG
jgi:hypothetical protein